MEMTIDMIINDCEQSIKQSELFIKTHQKNMEMGEIKEYQYYIERDKLTMDVMHKYQKMMSVIKPVIKMWKEDQKRFTLGDNAVKDEYLKIISEVIEDGNDD